MARFSKPPLASLGHYLVTVSVKRRQLECRVAMLISPEILQGLEGRRSLSMRKTTSQYAICEYAVASTGSQSQSCITMTVQSTGESLLSLVKASMVYNYKMKETKRTTGSQTFA